MNIKYLLVFVFLFANFASTTTNLSHWFDEFIRWFGNVFPQLPSPADRENYEESLMNTNQICLKYGYTTEEHNVTTSDNFVLKLYRITNGKNSKKNRKPILMMHGVTMSSVFWVSNPKTLPFFLADNGYDVWLGNFRGNSETYNLKYSRNQKKFWDFSWEEMGLIDIPAFIDYILKITGRNKVIYIGHSMGTTAGFVLFSTNREYHQKVAGFVALSPVTNTIYAPSFFQQIYPHYGLFTFLVRTLGIHYTQEMSRDLFKIWQYLYPAASKANESSLLVDISGYDPYLRNSTRTFVYASRGTEPTAMKVWIHYGQVYKKKGMYRFDYGSAENLRLYRSHQPPAFDLTQVKIPVAIVYGANDVFSDALDNALLMRYLPNLIDVKLIDYRMFSHVDIGFAVNADEFYYNNVLNYVRHMFNQSLFNGKKY